MPSPARSVVWPLLLVLAALSACRSTEAPLEESDDSSAGLPWFSAMPDAEEESTLGEGRWRRYRTNRFDDSMTSEQRLALERLESIGYVGGVSRARVEAGVTVLDDAEVSAGLNLYTSGHGPEAVLMDMEGRVLHRWRRDFWDIWPDYPIDRDAEATQHFRRAHVYPNGDLLAIFEGLGLVKLDAASNVLWDFPGKAHHDLWVAPDGDVWVLTREAHVVPRVSPDAPILEDFVSVLDAGGREKRRVSLLECFERSPPRFRDIWLRNKGRRADVFHTNSLEVLDGRFADRDGAFQAGRVLVSMLFLNTVAVIDLDERRVVWAQEGGFSGQHDPKLTDAGTMLIFDNKGGPGLSRILEIDPLDRSLKWEYRGTLEEPFLSHTCGTAQRLPNGNTLITESDNGRAFELTQDKRLVWEYVNPHRAGEDHEYVAVIFEVVRLPSDFPVGWALGD